ncbi:tetraacyldisaccharide 4'-kinase [Pasteurellaceae bacterium HPA106]|uniref:tetraacyldisaccharide 4'-kinase n=1 Tax=Spirabiliibacterium pneumoniae TaxID=221400 RepID=UPI001AADFDDF|nr:tetraacyldisaccharide 4'-kinase [Spirabiliibacterium pneumoniae]MBE2895551.1 tetraacyldisaccharide 4'-kinase [Spirabiliibacterium pneumoniae]
MKFWYKRTFLSYLLLPLSALFGLVASLRRWCYQHVLTPYKAPVPVVIVGNISVGGNGKTPVVIWLAQQLLAKGHRVGIISRGYGGEKTDKVRLVNGDSDPRLVGDEPVLIAKRAGVPVAVCPYRKRAIEALLAQHHIDVIIADDGMQHYKLARDIELAVIDGVRRLGNGFLLPAGPLRECPARLKTVDGIICNGAQAQQGEVQMRLKAQSAVNLVSHEVRPLHDFQAKTVVAMAGIGYPERFFSTLQRAGITPVATHSLADHQCAELSALKVMASVEQALLMTEKDAVKYHSQAQENWWYVPVEAEMSDEIAPVLAKIERLLT